MKHKPTLILGLGISGRSAAELLLHKKKCVHAMDSDELLLELPEIKKLQDKGLIISKENNEIDITQFDQIIVSPGISPDHHLYTQAKKTGIEIIGEVELACRYLKGPVLGITGTNGKTTVTLLVTHVLNFNGKPAQALGNVGIPLTSKCLEDSNLQQINVLELSSYQLETMQHKILDAAILLNITPDHLDRYQTIDDYFKAKIQITHCLKPNGTVFIENRCLKEFNHLLSTIKCHSFGYDSSCTLHTDLTHLYLEKKQIHKLPANLQKKESHHLSNLMAAFALCYQCGINAEEFFKALPSFEKPKHRIQFIKKHNGISFYDDSKGTNIDAVIKAVNSLDGQCILIAGGVDKGFPYSIWLNSFNKKVKCICAIGQSAGKIKNELNHSLPVHLCESLETAVKLASELAVYGDNVLLSPGCASYDMFRDYKHRGELFQEFVNKL